MKYASAQVLFLLTITNIFNQARQVPRPTSYGIGDKKSGGEPVYNKA